MVVDKKKPRITSAHPDRKPMPTPSNQKKVRKSSRGDLKVARIQSAAPAHAPKSQNTRGQPPLKVKSSVVDQDAAAAGLPPATTTPRNNENFVVQKKPHTNVK